MSREDDEARKTIPPERTALFYGGTALMGIGILLFLATAFGSVFGRNHDFGPGPHFGPGPGFGSGPDMRYAFAGVICMIVGGFLRTIGAQGLAGAGVVLDPKQSREDLEPYSRMAGGMIKDALDEVGVSDPEPVIKVRCQHCGKLNAEDAKFCQECGTPFVLKG